jgi:hypothetical protein
MDLGIQISLEGGEKLGTFLDTFPEKTSIALLRALKRGTDAARTETNRLVARDIGIKVSRVRQDTRTIAPTGSTLAGEVRASLKRIPLIELKQKMPPHSFIATMRSGHTGIFKRDIPTRSRAGKRSPSPGLPITELRKTSVGHVAAKYVEPILARGGDQYEAEMNRQLDRILRV